MKEGKLIIFSAPSGSGKTTIVRYLLKEISSLAFSISATSRKPRGKEEHGKDYYFLSKQEFASRVAANDFLEWEEVYRDNFYGTLKTEIERIWRSSSWSVAHNLPGGRTSGTTIFSVPLPSQRSR